MLPEEFLTRSGGLAGREVVSACGRPAVEAALGAGTVLRVARARYALPHVQSALRSAHALSGTASHLSAARWWGWEVREVPDLPNVIVPRHRNARQTAAKVWFRDLRPFEVVRPGVTGALRTVLDCAGDLPFPDGLAVADSALRHRAVGPDELVSAAAASPGRGRQRRLRVAAAASPLAANPFESALRALAIEAGLQVVPQVPLFTGARWVRPDLLDDGRGLAVEAESFRWHGERWQLTNDCVKYNDLTMLGLDLLRFSWEQVILNADPTRALLQRYARTGTAPWDGPQSTYPATNARSAA